MFADPRLYADLFTFPACDRTTAIARLIAAGASMNAGTRFFIGTSNGDLRLLEI